VDGVITSATNVNTDDVATVTVLKGPAATSLYGQRGEQGAVVITTKKGTRSRGVGVEINQSTTFEQVTGLPEYQNEALRVHTELVNYAYNDCRCLSWLLEPDILIIVGMKAGDQN
jgi:TonB-dependent SusC/RagA subfamily outer membrane receptor